MINQIRIFRLLTLCLIVFCFTDCNRDDSLQDSFTDNQETIDDDIDNDTDDNENNDNTNDQEPTGDDIDGDTDDNENNDDTDDSEDGDGEITEITLYKVVEGNITKVKDYEVTGSSLEFQNDIAKHQEIWELTKKVIPQNQMNLITEFLIFSGGSSGIAGYVVEKVDDLSKWHFAIAIDYAYEGGFNKDGELVHTLIHEFGHVLTLNITQVDATISDEDCMNYFTGEGCAKPEAYINLLQTRFWADIEDEFNAISTEEEHAAFYTKYRDRFVTNYAATNPGEDIAEVFARFVIRAGGVNGNAITEQKIQLMYDAEELTAVRDYIRQNDIVAKRSTFLPAEKLKRIHFCGTTRKRANSKF